MSTMARLSSMDFDIIRIVTFSAINAQIGIIINSISKYNYEKSATICSDSYGLDNYQLDNEICRLCKTVYRFNRPEILSRIYHVDEILAHLKYGRMEWGHYQVNWGA